jgi:hypothetical protein
VNFWTLTCIKRDDRVILIGVHTPEFSFEQEINRGRQATKERASD